MEKKERKGKEEKYRFIVFQIPEEINSLTMSAGP